MNKWQNVAMWVGVAMAVAMFLYPPWMHGYETVGTNIGAGFAPLWNRPIELARVDVAVLLAEWIVAAMVTAAAIVTLKGGGNE